MLRSTSNLSLHLRTHCHTDTLTWQRKIDIHLARMELANFSVRADVIDTRPQVLLLASQHR